MKKIFNFSAIGVLLLLANLAYASTVFTCPPQVICFQNATTHLITCGPINHMPVTDFVAGSSAYPGGKTIMKFSTAVIDVGGRSGSCWYKDGTQYGCAAYYSSGEDVQANQKTVTTKTMPWFTLNKLQELCRKSSQACGLKIN